MLQIWGGFCGEKVKIPNVFTFGIFGAYNRIRTGDLILTKDALYRLSYISTEQMILYIVRLLLSRSFVD